MESIRTKKRFIVHDESPETESKRTFHQDDLVDSELFSDNQLANDTSTTASIDSDENSNLSSVDGEPVIIPHTIESIFVNSSGLTPAEQQYLSEIYGPMLVVVNFDFTTELLTLARREELCENDFEFIEEVPFEFFIASPKVANNFDVDMVCNEHIEIVGDRRVVNHVRSMRRPVSAHDVEQQWLNSHEWLSCDGLFDTSKCEFSSAITLLCPKLKNVLLSVRFVNGEKVTRNMLCAALEQVLRQPVPWNVFDAVKQMAECVNRVVLFDCDHIKLTKKHHMASKKPVEHYCRRFDEGNFTLGSFLCSDIYIEDMQVDNALNKALKSILSEPLFIEKSSAFA